MSILYNTGTEWSRRARNETHCVTLKTIDCQDATLPCKVGEAIWEELEVSDGPGEYVHGVFESFESAVKAANSHCDKIEG